MPEALAYWVPPGAYYRNGILAQRGLELREVAR